VITLEAMVTSAGCVVGGGGDSGDMISVAGAGVGVVAAEGKVARVAESSTIIGFFFVLEVELPIGILSYDEGGYGVVNKPRGLTGEMMIVPYAVLVSEFGAWSIGNPDLLDSYVALP
jgi:hypothetical protein